MYLDIKDNNMAVYVGCAAELLVLFGQEVW